MVEDLFFGECLNTFECKECKNSNKMEEKILDLSVNFSKKLEFFLSYYKNFYFCFLFDFFKMMNAIFKRKEHMT